MCSLQEFQQTASFTRIDKFNDLRQSVETIGDWQSLCRNLDVDLEDILHDRDHSKDKCLQSYFNSDEAYWEEVVMAVVRPPLKNKRVAKEIAKKYLCSPNNDTILSMVKYCDTFY